MSMPSTTRCFSSVIASGLTLSNPTAIFPPENSRLQILRFEIWSLKLQPHFPNAQQSARQLRQLRHDFVEFLRHSDSQRGVHVDRVYAREEDVNPKRAVAGCFG